MLGQQSVEVRAESTNYGIRNCPHERSSSAQSLDREVLEDHANSLVTTILSRPLLKMALPHEVTEFKVVRFITSIILLFISSFEIGLLRPSSLGPRFGAVGSCVAPPAPRLGETAASLRFGGPGFVQLGEVLSQVLILLHSFTSRHILDVSLTPSSLAGEINAIGAVIFTAILGDVAGRSTIVLLVRLPVVGLSPSQLVAVDCSPPHL